MSYFFAASVQEREEWVEAISWCAVNSNLDNGYIVEKVHVPLTAPSLQPPFNLLRRTRIMLRQCPAVNQGRSSGICPAPQRS